PKGNSHVEAVKNEIKLRLKSDLAFRDRYLDRVRYAKTEYLKDGKSCPKCGASAEELTWFRYESLPQSPLDWRDGWVTFCEKCNEEVDLFPSLLWAGAEGESTGQYDETFPDDPQVCPVHIHALVLGKAPVRYGYVFLPSADWGFWVPYARSVILG